MRPSPLVLLAFVAIGFALIAVPLARLTRAEGARRVVAPGTAAVVDGTGAPGVPTLVRIRFAHAPLAVTVMQDSRLVAEFGVPEDPGSGQMERSAVLAGPVDAPVDLLVEATWPAGTPPTALGVEVEPDGAETRRATVWAEDLSLSELLTFSWK